MADRRTTQRGAGVLFPLRHCPLGLARVPPTPARCANPNLGESYLSGPRARARTGSGFHTRGSLVHRLAVHFAGGFAGHRARCAYCHVAAGAGSAVAYDRRDRRAHLQNSVRPHRPARFISLAWRVRGFLCRSERLAGENIPARSIENRDQVPDRFCCAGRFGCDFARVLDRASVPAAHHGDATAAARQIRRRSSALLFCWSFCCSASQNCSRSTGCPPLVSPV